MFVAERFLLDIVDKYGDIPFPQLDILGNHKLAFF